MSEHLKYDGRSFKNNKKKLRSQGPWREDVRVWSGNLKTAQSVDDLTSTTITILLKMREEPLFSSFWK